MTGRWRVSSKFEHKNSALLSSRTLVGWCYSFVIGVWIWLDGVAFALQGGFNRLYEPLRDILILNIPSLRALVLHE